MVVHAPPPFVEYSKTTPSPGKSTISHGEDSLPSRSQKLTEPPPEVSIGNEVAKRLPLAPNQSEFGGETEPPVFVATTVIPTTPPNADHCARSTLGSKSSN